LIGAYKIAPLEDIWAKGKMKTLGIFGIEPNDVFAETYVAALLQQRFQHLRSVDAIVDILHHKPAKRLEASTGALEDFEAAGVRVSGLCRRLRRSLHLLKQ
jgi:hypothetical protein